MGINLEYITFLSCLKKNNKIPIDGKVCELGAQSISADPTALVQHMNRLGLDCQHKSIDTAKALYTAFGFKDYVAIDATGEEDSLTHDLNKNIKLNYSFNKTFDLVTDLGTIEHVFDVYNAFRNAHELCKTGGVMIHALPSNCNTNHGYYTVQPRMIADLAAVNDYCIEEFVFTVDYKPILYKYTMKNYKAYDDRDLMFYVALSKNHNSPFRIPFDSMFYEKSKLFDYKATFTDENFKSYIKDNWMNIRPNSLLKVPTGIIKVSFYRIIIKAIIDRLGRYN